MTLEWYPFLAPEEPLVRASLHHASETAAELPFHLSQAQQDDLADLNTTHRLVLLSARGTADANAELGAWDLRYPPDLRLSIDGTPLAGDFTGSKHAPGAVHPPVIEVTDEPAHVLSLTFSGSFTFAVAYARDIAPASLVPLIPAGPPPERQTSIDITCPFTLAPLRHPAYSTACSHPGYFDALAFLRVARAIGPRGMVCPMCGRAVGWSTLRFEPRLKTTLQQLFPPEVEKDGLKETHDLSRTDSTHDLSRTDSTHDLSRTDSNSISSDSSDTDTDSDPGHPTTLVWQPETHAWVVPTDEDLHENTLVDLTLSDSSSESSASSGAAPPGPPRQKQ